TRREVAARACRGCPSCVDRRKDMLTVGTKRQWLHPAHGCHWKRTVKMREKIAAARHFVFQGFPQLFFLDGNEEQLRPPLEMLCGGFLDLSCSGEMDETILPIHRSTGKKTALLGLAPQRSRAYLVDQSRHDRAIMR